MTEVSVIIPTYNRAEFISECVQSVLAQTLPAREIIIVDDGSTDATYNILNDLGFNSISTPKTVLRYIFQENQGVSSARNLGIKEAKSEYIALLDSDDLWLRGKLDQQVIAFRGDIQHNFRQLWNTLPPLFLCFLCWFTRIPFLTQISSV